MRTPITATNFAIAEIRRLIVEGRLPPGRKVDQDELAKMMGLSRLPVRQALAHLAERRFVELRDRRGAIVAPVSVNDMKDLYEFRNGLESWAFSLCFSDLVRVAAQRLAHILTQSAEAVRCRNLGQFMELNRQFHFALFEAVDNNYLQRALKNHFDVSERYHWCCLSQRSNLEQSLHDHECALQEIEKGDQEAFLSVVIRHNRKTVDWVEANEASFVAFDLSPT